MYLQQDNFNYQLLPGKTKPRDRCDSRGRRIYIQIYSTNIFAVRFSLSLLTTK